MSVVFQPNPPNISFKEYFETETIIIGLYWMQEPDESLVSYRIHAVISNTNTTYYSVSVVDKTRVNLSLAYNTPYTVNVVAKFCSRKNSTTVIEVNYRK